MKRRIRLLFVSLVCATGAWAQHVSFPYPEVPSRISDLPTRLTFMLQHFWERYDFSNTSPANQQVGEQGFVDFINLMQYADSSTCAKAAGIFAEGVISSEQRLNFFEELARHYLENPQSPLRNDMVYCHLLRAFPASPQRQFLIQQLSLNQPGMIPADCSFVDAEGNRVRLYDVQSQYILLVFFDPQCEHCQEQMPQIQNEPVLHKTSGLKVVYIDTNLNPGVMKVFYLPSLPSLYLLDTRKRVVVKDGSLQQIVNRLSVLLP